MSVVMRTKGLEQIASLRQRLREKQKLYDRIGIRFLEWIDQNFRDEGIEKKWTPLRASTIFGRRKGSNKPLLNTGKMKQEANYRASDRQVVVGWPPESVARYHHFGTHGPYEIRPRNKKALKFFAPPMSTIATGKQRTILQQRKKGTPRIGLIKGNTQSIMFARVVHHPGLPIRQLLPSTPLAKSIARGVIEDYLKEKARG